MRFNSLTITHSLNSLLLKSSIFSTDWDWKLSSFNIHNRSPCVLFTRKGYSLIKRFIVALKTNRGWESIFIMRIVSIMPFRCTLCQIFALLLLLGFTAESSPPAYLCSPHTPLFQCSSVLLKTASNMAARASLSACHFASIASRGTGNGRIAAAVGMPPALIPNSYFSGRVELCRVDRGLGNADAGTGGVAPIPSMPPDAQRAVGWRWALYRQAVWVFESQNFSSRLHQLDWKWFVEIVQRSNEI